MDFQVERKEESQKVVVEAAPEADCVRLAIAGETIRDPVEDSSQDGASEPSRDSTESSIQDHTVSLIQDPVDPHIPLGAVPCAAQLNKAPSQDPAEEPRGSRLELSANPLSKYVPLTNPSRDRRLFGFWREHADKLLLFVPVLTAVLGLLALNTTAIFACIPVLYILPGLLSIIKGKKWSKELTLACILLGWTGVLWAFAMYDALGGKVSERRQVWPFSVVFFMALLSVICFLSISSLDPAVALSFENMERLGVTVALASGIPMSCILAASIYRLSKLARQKEKETGLAPAALPPLGVGGSAQAGAMSPTHAALAIFLCSGLAGFALCACGGFQLMQPLLQLGSKISGNLAHSIFAISCAALSWFSLCFYAASCAYFQYRIAVTFETREEQRSRSWKLIPRLLPGVGFIILPFWVPFCTGNPLSVVIVHAGAYMLFTILMKRQVVKYFAEEENGSTGPPAQGNK